MVSAWELGKIMWGVGMTLATAYFGYQQNHIAAATVRPSLNIDVSLGSPSFREHYGQLSHTFRVTNEGTVSANNVTFTVITKKGSKVLHEDRNDNIGSLSIREEMTYVVHAQDGNGPEELTEEFQVSYDGEDGWWCDQVFTYTATYIYDAMEKRWAFRPKTKASEVVNCI